MKFSKDIRVQYRNLENEYRQLRRNKSYQKAQENLQKMIDVVQDHPMLFDEPHDRIRILQARKLMVSYEEERLRGGRMTPQLLREAAAFSTPSVCLGQPCQELDPQICKSRLATLSSRQTKMCVQKITYICDALKIEAALAVHDLEAALAVHDLDYQRVLEKRRMAVKLQKTLVELDPDPTWLKNQRYLEYWCFITEGYVSLLNGNFDLSKEWFKKALSNGKLLNLTRCFPNYFRDIKEIEAHQFYIDAVEKFQSAQFGAACVLFERWLSLNPERRGKNDLRFDNIYIFSIVCKILERLQQHEEVQKADWDAIDEFFEVGYVALTTWALRTRLNWLRELSFRLHREGQHSLQLILDSEIAGMAREWRLLISDTVLLGEDRTAGFQRRAILPPIVDIFDDLNQSRHDWQQILIQNLKNALLLIADYEFKRYLVPPPEEENLALDRRLTEPSEAMSIPQLTEVLLLYLGRRSEEHKSRFEDALQHLSHFASAIDAKDFTTAVRAEKNFLEEIRFWPHIIRVKEQKDIPKPLFLDEDNPNFLAKETIALRLWNHDPNTVTFEGPQDLETGSYYYLRPRWNLKTYHQYRIRHEQFHQSDLPRWLNVFSENIFRGGKTEPRRFHDWILQFNDSERLLACQLYDMLKFYGEDEVRERWLDVYRTKLPPEAKTRSVAYFGLGHTAKSGPYNCHYHFRQAMTKLVANERSFEFKEAFREISEFGEKIEKPQTVIFVDDFIGTGEQAIRSLRLYFDRHEWLKTVTVYYCVLIGFKYGIQIIKAALSDKLRDVFVSELLDEKDKAFSEENPIWKSEQARRQAEQWAAEIGRQVLTGRADYDLERDKLGWGGSQALVVFHYNVPNNTLPLFWGTGKRNGKAWKPLLDRYD